MKFGNKNFSQKFTEYSTWYTLPVPLGEMVMLILKKETSTLTWTLCASLTIFENATFDGILLRKILRIA